MSGLTLEHADPMFKKLSQARLPDAARAYEPSDVAEERWAKDEMFFLDPVFWEVRGMKPGRWAKQKPKTDAVRHLLDSRGQILAMIEEHEFGGGEVRVDETLVRRSEGQTIVARIEGGGRDFKPRLLRLDWADSEGDTPSLIETRDRFWASRSRCTYDDGRLVRIDREDQETRFGEGKIRQSIIEFEYDDLGRRERITERGVDDGSESKVIFQNTRGLPSKKEATEFLRPVLLEAIVSAVRAMAIAEPVWCVKLIYERGATILPPSVVVCTASRRDEIMAKPELQEAWNETLYPDEHVNHELDMPGNPAVMGRLIDLLEDQPESKRIKLLREVAAELAAGALRGVISSAPDFGVVAVDLPHDELAQAVRATVPKDVVKTWKSAKIL